MCEMTKTINKTKTTIKQRYIPLLMLQTSWDRKDRIGRVPARYISLTCYLHYVCV